MNIGMCFSSREENISGINRVILNSVNEVLKIAPQNNYYAIEENYLKFPIIENEKNKEDLQKEEFCRNNKIDIIHSYFRPFWESEYSCKRILTIYDLTTLINREWIMKESMYDFFDKSIRKSACMSDVIITISESTKRDVMKFYEIPEERVRVVYPGLDLKLTFTEENYALSKKYVPDTEYILSVCTLEPRKNLRGLINGFIQFKMTHPKSDLKLVLTGKMGWDKSLLSFLDSIGTYKKDIILTGFVPDDALAGLYMGALAIAYVPFYEGFGLPILEAMAAGKAVITSNTSSMPEVGGEAVVYSDPYDIDSIADAIERLVYSETLRAELEKKAISQAKIFSYHKAAKETVDIYNSIM